MVKVTFWKGVSGRVFLEGCFWKGVSGRVFLEGCIGTKKLKGVVDGNYRVEIYRYLLDLTRNNCERMQLQIPGRNWHNSTVW
jgi:hypothetical protein